MACYAAGEPWTFYELNPAVVALARDEKLFGEVARAVRRTTIKVGDARLRLAEEPDAHFAMIAVDAFSSDAIPAHLLTREALAMYRRKLREDGVVLINLSSRFADLPGVVAATAAPAGFRVWWREDAALTDAQRKEGKSPSSWVLLTTGAEGPAGWKALVSPPHEEGWTDDLASVLPVLRWR